MYSSIDEVKIDAFVGIGQRLYCLSGSSLMIFGVVDRVLKSSGYGLLFDMAYSPVAATSSRAYQDGDVIHTGRLSCFRAGISTRLPRSMASPRVRVACGMITSSI